MKRTIFVFTVLVVLSSISWAQTWGPQTPGQIPGQQPMMPQRMPYGAIPPGTAGNSMVDDAMNQIMLQRIEVCRGMILNQGTELQEMMRIMKDMMKIQTNLVKGATDEEKKKMTEELVQMNGKLDKMTTDMQAMMKKSGLSAAPAEPGKTKAEPKKGEQKKAGSKKDNSN
jgi:hypothetical protein